VGDQEGGVLIVNIADPSSPNVVTSTGGNYCEVAVSQNVLFADDPNFGIYVMDISNPTNPTIIGYYPNYEIIQDMEVQGQYLYTTSESDFHIYQVDALTGVVSPRRITPHNFKLYPCFPNPFNPSTMLTFDISSPGWATLAVYNIYGEKTAELMDSFCHSGKHSVPFRAGNLASGIYFARLQVAGMEQTQKMILIK
jgi:hypothetical protein